MYVVLVPVFGLFLGRKGSAQLWVSMAIAVVGLYLLCMKDGFGSIQSSDGLLLLCAVLFSFQIMAVDHFSPQMDGVRLSLVEFFGGVGGKHRGGAAVRAACHGRICHLRRAHPVLRRDVQRRGLHPAILGQRDLNPAVASLIMCLESVFSALGGWLLLHQNLSFRESTGCVLLFAAVVLAQLPLGRLMRSKA